MNGFSFKTKNSSKLWCQTAQAFLWGSFYRWTSGSIHHHWGQFWLGEFLQNVKPLLKIWWWVSRGVELYLVCLVRVCWGRAVLTLSVCLVTTQCDSELHSYIYIHTHSPSLLLFSSRLLFSLVLFFFHSLFSPHFIFIFLLLFAPSSPLLFLLFFSHLTFPSLIFFLSYSILPFSFFL